MVLAAGNYKDKRLFRRGTKHAYSKRASFERHYKRFIFHLFQEGYVKHFKLGVVSFIAIFILVACQQVVSPKDRQTTALFTDADLDKAVLELAEAEESSGQELADIPDGSLTTLADYPAGDLSSAAVLPGAKGFIYYQVRDTSVVNQYKIYRFDQSTDVNTLVYEGQRALNGVAGNAAGTIVYFSARETTSATSDYEIYKLNVNTSGVTRLTNNNSDDINVASSADANRITFEGLGAGGQKAVYYRIYSSATNFIERRLAGSLDQFEPSISSNGNYIAFVRLLNTGSYRIMLHNISANTYLTVNSDASPLNHPSPNDAGSKVAWSRNDTSGYQVRVKNLTTTGITTAVSSTTLIRHPHLTRDGNYLTYGLGVSNSFNVFTKNLSSGAFVQGTNLVRPVSASGMYWQTPAGTATATIQGRVTRGSGSSLVAGNEVRYNYSYSETAKQQNVSDLLARAAAQGSVRVIVTLAVGFRPEGTLSAPATTNQRQAIQQAQTSLLSRYSGQVSLVTRFQTVPLVVVIVDAAGLQALDSDPSVVWIEEDVAQPPTLAESTAIVGAPAAWSSGYTGSGQAVAILDTGVDRLHSFFGGRVVSEACYSSSFSGPGYTSTKACPGGSDVGGGAWEQTGTGSAAPCTAANGCDHGTHVAGIAAGNGASFDGVARDAGIIAVQVFSNFNASYCANFGYSGTCTLSFTSDQIKGLERVYALRNSFSVASANMSLGGGQSTANCDSDSRKLIIDNLRSVGIATVIASGNNGFTNALSFPACISSAVSVGSTNDGSSGATPTDAVSSFSNSASFLSLLAPGYWINSSVPGGGFAEFAGTSMAAPHVAGAWAIMKQRFPSESVSQILSRLQSTGVGITDSRNGITKSRIQVDAALSLPTTAVVRLYNASTGQLVATQDANSSDDYSFSNVASGNYYVQAYIDTGDDTQGSSEKAGAFGGSAVPTVVNASGTVTANITTGTPTEVEPNNNTATNNVLLLGTFINGEVVTTNYDYFKLLVPSTGNYTLETFSCDGRLDTIIDLYNASGTFLTSDDQGGTGNCSQIVYNFTSAGTYFVRVSGYLDSSGFYTLGIR
jgi:subtilisin